MAHTVPVELEIMRATLLLDSDPSAAARQAGAILARVPGHAEATLLLATAMARVGDGAAAVAVLEPLAAEHPESAAMQYELGLARTSAGQLAMAIQSLERAVQLDETLAEAWRELARCHFGVGSDLEGDRAYARYLRLVTPAAELADASALLADKRIDAAESMIRARLAKAPQDPFAMRLLAECARRRDDHRGAADLLRECLDVVPGYAEARFDLARTLDTLQQHAAVFPLLDRLLALEPLHPLYLVQRASTLRALGRDEEAIAVLEALLETAPDDTPALLLLGHMVRARGDRARAIGAYRRVIERGRDVGSAYWSLANLKTYDFSDEDVAAIESQLASGTARGAGRVHLEFALGKALEDRGDYARSFEHYARGNAWHRATFAYDAALMTEDFARARKVLTPEFFATRSDWGCPAHDPIFVVGLPRSGSTLIEQILASHSQVEGTSELPDMPALATELSTRRGPTDHPKYPDSLLDLSRSSVDVLAERYLESTRARRSSGRPRFVDKMLHNFTHIGLIQLLFPRATIIDARRHPLGCGFSCYKQLFARSIVYSYDLAEMGSYYRDYAALMAHYDAVLPGRVHRVHYENMVANPEAEVRALLEACGLPFEPECLRFYETRRKVQTISSEQVRRPIYSDSVSQWRHYEPWLGPLLAQVDELVRDYPAQEAPGP